MRRRRVYVTSSLLLLALLLSCRSRPDAVPPTRLVGAAQPLIEFLEDCQSISASRLASWCGELAQSMRACTAVVAVCSPTENLAEGGTPCRLAESVECVDRKDLTELGLGDEDWLFQGPLPGILSAGTSSAGTVELRGRSSSDGAIRVSARLNGSQELPLGRWLPSAESPGQFQLSDTGAFAHARWRPDGGLVPQRTGKRSLADRLYGLRSELFSATVLTGSVEVVAFVPNPGDRFPGSAAALDFHLRRPAIAAMESYIADLQKEWPLVRNDYSFNGFEGACLNNLRVMPGLAPCYLATDSALVVGWNRTAIEGALTPASRSQVEVAGGEGAGSRATVDFAALALADRRLAATRSRDVAFNYPFRSLDVVGRRDGSGFFFDLTLHPLVAP